MFSLTFKIKWIIRQNIPILGTIIGQKTFVGKAQKKTFFFFVYGVFLALLGFQSRILIQAHNDLLRQLKNNREFEVKGREQ